MSASVARAAGLLLGTLADELVPDPRRQHPVAWFGSWAAWLERRTWRDDRTTGVLHVAGCLAPLAVLGVAAEVAGRRNAVVRVATTALATWAVTGGASLRHEGDVMAGLLQDGDMAAARVRLGHLCGRLPDDLDEPELARAALESVAENTADAVVAPLFWGAVAGVPGLLVHRGVNTLDAMVGHHSERYEHFGWAAARLDDAMCWLPARITGALACALAGSRRGQAWRTMRRDAHEHPSPNGGWCESAFAGALGVQLGGRNVYPGGRVEHRGLLGDGPRPVGDDLVSATRLERRVQWTAAVLAVLGVLASTGSAGVMLRELVEGMASTGSAGGPRSTQPGPRSTQPGPRACRGDSPAPTSGGSAGEPAATRSGPRACRGNATHEGAVR